MLVPLDEFLPLVTQLGISVRGLERLADRFRVALEVIHERLLVAGALSLSLWRVAPADRTGHPSADFLRLLTQTPVTGPRAATDIPDLLPSSVVLPNIVLEAAQHGRAQAERLGVKSGEAGRQVAGLAACHEPYGSPRRATVSPGGVRSRRAGSLDSDTLVTLVLLPPEAAESVRRSGPRSARVIPGETGMFAARYGKCSNCESAPNLRRRLW